jgi:glyceraldehyde 3-phosphate dehydrogenase
MNILLNGVGRIGKAILRMSLKETSFNIVAINELNSNIENIAYSINYDSTYGKLDDKFKQNENYIENSHSKIEILNYENLIYIDYTNIDLVVDASGTKVECDDLKKLDVKHIILTHPEKNADINVILGVNETSINQQKIISTSSCNATALLPLLKIIDDNFGIEYGDIATIHPLLNHQKALDSNCVSKSDREVTCNFEFGRSSTQNIIPSGTTTIEACSYVQSHINNELFSSNSFRVPTATVGAINVTINLKNKTTKDKLLEVLNDFQKNQNYKILLNSDEKLVSSDFQQEQYTTIIDHRFTNLTKGKLAKFVIWYDNEWGYASKVVDILKILLPST